MGQPVKSKVNKKCNTKAKTVTPPSKQVKTKKVKSKRTHPEYGTSKLEIKFAKEFLEKLGIKYVYQYKAESIGRYFDFYCVDANVLIEVDGDFFHGRNLVYEEMSPMQKHNKFVDDIKNKWALSNCIPIIRIWEYDINKNPEKVMDLLRTRIGEYTNMKIKKDEKNKRH